jgi:hypothetical protein
MQAAQTLCDCVFLQDCSPVFGTEDEKEPPLQDVKTYSSGIVRPSTINCGVTHSFLLGLISLSSYLKYQENIFVYK